MDFIGIFAMLTICVLIFCVAGLAGMYAPGEQGYLQFSESIKYINSLTTLTLL